MQQKWKYTNKKPGFDYGMFLRVPEEKKTIIKVKNYEIMKKAVDGINRTVFQADVCEVDGMAMDKIWTIFNYDNVIEMKKRLLKVKAPFTLAVTKHVNEDTLEDFYEIEIVKE